MPASAIALRANCNCASVVLIRSANSRFIEPALAVLSLAMPTAFWY